MTSATLPVIAIVGPTACGKTRRAVEIARAFAPAEIVSADSRQVYRGMDIGTGKDLGEYGGVPYHLIDICDAGEKYNLFRYLTDARAAISDIRSRGVLPIVCGGTGMYVESLVKGMSLPEVPANPELRQSLEGKSLAELTRILEGLKTLHNVTDVDTPARAVRAIEIQQWYLDHPEEAQDVHPTAPLPDTHVFCLDIPREERRARISARLRARIDEGMIDEVRGLIASGVNPDDLIYYGLEYKYVTLHVLGRLTLAEMTSQLETAIHQFAKRQMTWFRGMERRGVAMTMVPYDLPTEALLDLVRPLIRK